jgi:hypothetical protein
LLTLPGYFRPTKIWDLVVVHEGKLVAALEFKSQVGPSFGNNFNNRAEEAIGSGLDFWTAYREGAFGQQGRPFLGWLTLVEDAEKSRQPVGDDCEQFVVFPEFNGASYLERYEVLCRKLVMEQLYSAAALIAAPRSGGQRGNYSELSDMTAMREFVVRFAAHIAGTSRLSWD